MRARGRDGSTPRPVNALSALAPVLFGALAVVVALQMLGMTSPALSPALSPAQGARGIVNAPVESAGCGQPSPLRPGTTAERSVMSGGQHRTYRLHVPTQYTPSASAALVLDFHGDESTAAQFERYTGLSQVADQQRFLVAYPQGLPGRDGQTGWAGVGDGQPQADDVLFASDLLNEVQRAFCVDPHRIYVMGFSRGGGMASLLACRLAERVAAVAPVSGAFFGSVEAGCSPQRPVPILEFHDSADPVVPYAGGGGENFLPVLRWLDGWVTRDGCSGPESVFYASNGAIGEKWSGCSRNALVEHYKLDGAGHDWPGGADNPQALNAGAVAWDFFRTHPLDY